MRKCYICKEEKDLEAFRRQKSPCRVCERIERKKYKKAYQPGDWKKTTKVAARRRLRHRLYLISLLGGKCVKCETSDVRVLQFDHIDPKSKEFGINKRLYYSLKVLEPEALKCQLLCANCHVIKTQECGDTRHRKSA